MPARRGHKALATAFHGKTADGADVVGIGNLRVMITNDDGSWFAQGLEIDYAAQGESLDDAKRRFEQGLAATITEHLRVYGTIERLLQPAPREVWQEFLGPSAMVRAGYSQLSFHKFEGIAYFKAKAA
jgi:hypothetical protein